MDMLPNMSSYNDLEIEPSDWKLLNYLLKY